MGGLACMITLELSWTYRHGLQDEVSFHPISSGFSLTLVQQHFLPTVIDLLVRVHIVRLVESEQARERSDNLLTQS